MVMNDGACEQEERNVPQANAERVVVLARQANGSFGIALKEVSVIRRDTLEDGSTFEYPTTYFCVEPSDERSTLSIGGGELQAGDVLLAVNDEQIASLEKAAIVSLIIGTPSGEPLHLTVQHLPELDRRNSVSPTHTAVNGDSRFAHQLKQNGTLAKANGESVDIGDEEHVWVVHRHGFAAGRLLARASGSRCRVLLDAGGEPLDVGSELVEQRNSTASDRIEDLVRLRYLNESSLLNVVRQRFAIQLFSTWCGPHLLVVNAAGFAQSDFGTPSASDDTSSYTERAALFIRQLVARNKTQPHPPHAFAVAERALRELLLTETSQSVVLLGASGAGKTSTLRHLLHYFVHCYGRQPALGTIDAAFLLLNAFGGTRTPANANASRYATLATLEFDAAPRLRGLHLQISLVERTRVARRTAGEPSFHVLYHLVSGADNELRNSLHLNQPAGPTHTRNRYVNALQRADDVHRARAAWRRIEHVFDTLAVHADERRAVYVLLAAIYHLGKLQFVQDTTSASHALSDRTGLIHAAALLDCDEKLLEATIFSSTTPVAPVDALDAFAIGLYTEALSLVVSFINRALLSATSNTAATAGVGLRQLHILDIPGAPLLHESDTAAQRAAGFRELLANYCNERVAQLFHHANFTMYEDLYSQERVELEVDLRRIATHSPATLVALLDRDRLVSVASLRRLTRTRSSQNAAPDCEPEDVLKGLFWIVDDEAARLERQRSKAAKVGRTTQPDASDEILLARLALVQRELLRQFVAGAGAGSSRNSAYTSRNGDVGFAAVAKLLKRVKGSQSRLVVQHLNATSSVIYDTAAWLRDARECGGSSSFDVAARLAALSRSAPLVSALALFGTDQTLVADLLQRAKPKSSLASGALRNPFRDWRGEPAELNLNSVDPRIPGLRRAVQAVRNLSTTKRASLSAQTKLQLDALLDLVSKSRQHFIVCLLPQTGAGLAEIRQQVLAAGTPAATTASSSADRLVNTPLLRVQFRAFQLLAATQYYRFGFPEAKPFREFRRLFEPFARARAQADSTEGHRMLLAQAPFLGDDKLETQKIIETLCVDGSSYRLGTCQVFMRAGTLDSLFRSRDEFVTDLIVQVQARARGYLSRKKTERRQAEDEAVRCIQQNFLPFVELRRWRWWHLYEAVRPLGVFRKREDELAQLRTALNNAERDAHEARARCDQLDARCRQLETELVDERDELGRVRDSLARETGSRNNLRRQLDEALERADRSERRARALELEEESILDSSLTLRDLAVRPALSSNEERALRDALARGEREQIAQAARNLVLSSAARSFETNSEVADEPATPVDVEESPTPDAEPQSDYREQTTQLTRSVEQLRKRLRDCRSDFDEELAATRRMLERRNKELEDERSEALADAKSAHEKLARCSAEARDLRANCDELRAAQLEAERTTRRAESELTSTKLQLRAERELRERVQRDHADTLEHSRQLELDVQNSRVELERAIATKVAATVPPFALRPAGTSVAVGNSAPVAHASTPASIDASKHPGQHANADLETLRTMVGEYEHRIHALEGELDEEQVTLQRLEQAKVRLELGFEKQRQQFQREMADKDLERADAQASALKRIKQLEAQIEEDQAEKQRLVRERRETERQVAELINQVSPRRDRDGEKQRLTRELKRAKQQIKEMEEQLDELRAQGDAAARQAGRELKRQVEELEAEKEAMVRARHALEAEMEDLESRLTDASRHEAELRAKLDSSIAERSEVQSALEDREVELQYLTTRYKTIVQQTSIDQQTVAQLTKENAELLAEVEQQRAVVAEYQERVDLAQLDKIDKSELLKYEARVRDAENKQELEHASRVRCETLLERAREQIVGLESAKQSALDQLEIETEKTRKLTKQLREIREMHSELQHRFEDSDRRRQDLQTRLESLEQDYEQAQSDLRLAFRRISDLQALLDADDDDPDSNNERDPRSMERCQNLLNQADNAIIQSKLRCTPTPGGTRSGTNNATPSGVGSPVVRPGASSGLMASWKRAQSPASSRHVASRRSSTSSSASNL